MRRIYLLCIFLLFASGNLSRLHAQSYPPFTVNICTPASSGYYFTDPFSVITPNYPHTQMILDAKGKVLYYHSLPGSSIHFSLQPNGLISYNQGNQFYFIDSTFNIVDSVTTQNGIYQDSHEIQVLPNGHYLLLGYEFQVMDLSAYHYFNHAGDPGSPTAIVKCVVIQELDQSHNVVFEWHSKNYFSFDDCDSIAMNSPVNVDWTHSNSVEMDDDGNILLSSRHFDEITKINRSDSSIIWRLGGKRNQFLFTNDTNMFLLQHDIRRNPSGTISFFDNGRQNPFHHGSGKEYQLDENNLTATLVSHFSPDTNLNSQAMGSFQQLPNGNTVVDYGIEPGIEQPFDVFDPAGNIQFQISFADSLWSYRTFNYDTLPWQLPRTQITCYTIGNQSFLDAGPGYPKYIWSTGDTTQVIPVTTTDTFSVFVKMGNGGFMRSYEFVVSDLQNVCGLTNISGLNAAAEFTVYPNPVTDILNIQSESFNGKETSLSIIDYTGKKLKDKMISASGNQISLEVKDLPPGIYVAIINGVAKRFVKI